jgi:hypothetical protein
VLILLDLRIGDAAPDFNLQDENGLPVSLKDYLGKKVVVLYFYPKDFTSGFSARAWNWWLARKESNLHHQQGWENNPYLARALIINLMQSRGLY